MQKKLCKGVNLYSDEEGCCGRLGVNPLSLNEGHIEKGWGRGTNTHTLSSMMYGMRPSMGKNQWRQMLKRTRRRRREKRAGFCSRNKKEVFKKRRKSRTMEDIESNYDLDGTTFIMLRGRVMLVCHARWRWRGAATSFEEMRQGWYSQLCLFDAFPVLQISFKDSRRLP